MIHTWSDLLVAIKKWLDTPLEFKKKQKPYEQTLSAFYDHMSTIDPWGDKLTRSEKDYYAGTCGDPQKRADFIEHLRNKYGLPRS